MTVVDGRIEAARIESLIRLQPLSLVTQALCAPFFVFILHTVWPKTGLMIWFVAITTLVAVRFILWLGYRNRTLEVEEARSVARIWTVLVFCNGAIWGLPCALFFPTDNIAIQGFMVFVILGMAAAAVGTLSSHLPAFYSFLVLGIMPLNFRLILEPGAAYMAMGFMFILLALVLIGNARNLNKTLTDALQLQMEKSDLVEELTEARHQAESANAAKSAFLATVSHELRTPLNAVLGFSQLMNRELHGPIGHNKYKEYTQLISESGDHLLQLINELIDLSRAEAGQIDLQEQEIVIDDMLALTIRSLEPIAQRNGIVLMLQLEDQPCTLKADPKRMRQILLNVINNAIKFTPTDGQVMVSTRQEEGTLCISVKDTGIGMSEEDQLVAFEYFGRGDNVAQQMIEGAGIGLPLTRFLMQLHDGEIVLSSAPDWGTEVILRFPAERVIETSRSDAVLETGSRIDINVA